MRVVGRDLIRGGHYGQRSCEPHSKAEHMAAPTNAAKHEKSSCQPGAVHTWHVSDMSGQRGMSAYGDQADLMILQADVWELTRLCKNADTARGDPRLLRGNSGQMMSTVADRPNR